MLLGSPAGPVTSWRRWWMNIDCIRTDNRPTYEQMNEVCVVYFRSEMEFLKAKLICYIPPTD